MKRDWLNELLGQLGGHLDLEARQREQLLAGSQVPWWLSALLGLAAWISSLFFILAFLGPWLMLIEGTVGRGVAGVLLILAALWLFRRGQPFANQIGLALSLTGQGLLVFLLTERLNITQDNLRAPALFCMLLAGILLWLPSSFLHRHVCALLVLTGAAVLMGDGTALGFYGVVLAALACALWLCRQRWASHQQANRIRALADAATLMSLLLAAMPHQQLLTHMFDFQSDVARHWIKVVYPAGMGIILLSVVAWLIRDMKGLMRWSVLGITALVAMLAQPAPGLVLTIALGLALFHASNRSWLVLLPVFATFYLFVLYYSLHISLLEKSLLMILCGAILLVGGRLMPRWSRLRT